MGALRICKGEVPYKDFFIPYTPFSFYFLALFYKIFGASILTGRIVAIFLSFIFLIGIYLLSKKAIFNPLFNSIPLSVSIMAGFTMWHFASHHWLGDIFTIFSILSLVYFFENRKRRFLYLSGFLSGMCFISINDQGLYNSILLPLAFSIYLKVGLNERTKEILKTLFHFLLFCSFPIIILFGYLLLKVPISEIYYDLIIFPFTSYKQLEGNRMGIFYPFKELIYVLKSGVLFNKFYYHFFAFLSTSFIAFLPYITIIFAILTILKRKGNDLISLLLISGATIMILTAARRWAPINLIWASSVPSIFFAFTLEKIPSFSKKVTTHRLLSSLVISISIFIIFIFCTFGISKSVLLFDYSTNIKIESEAGVLYLDKPIFPAKLQGLLKAVKEIVPENEYLFTRQIPLLNFLTKRNNPTKIDFFNPPIYSPKKQIDEVIDTLEKTHTNYIATFEFEFDEKNLFDIYLKEKFECVWDNQFFRIYKRKA